MLLQDCRWNDDDIPELVKIVVENPKALLVFSLDQSERSFLYRARSFVWIKEIWYAEMTFAKTYVYHCAKSADFAIL